MPGSRGILFGFLLFVFVTVSLRYTNNKNGGYPYVQQNFHVLCSKTYCLRVQRECKPGFATKANR